MISNLSRSQVRLFLINAAAAPVCLGPSSRGLSCAMVEVMSCKTSKRGPFYCHNPVLFLFFYKKIHITSAGWCCHVSNSGAPQMFGATIRRYFIIFTPEQTTYDHSNLYVFIYILKKKKKSHIILGFNSSHIITKVKSLSSPQRSISLHVRLLLLLHLRCCDLLRGFTHVVMET